MHGPSTTQVSTWYLEQALGTLDGQEAYVSDPGTHEIQSFQVLLCVTMEVMGASESDQGRTFYTKTGRQMEVGLGRWDEEGTSSAKVPEAEGERERAHCAAKR